MPQQKVGRNILMICLVGGIAILAALGVWKARGTRPMLIQKHRPLYLVLNTHGALTAVVPPDHAGRANTAFTKARLAINNVQRLMDVYSSETELARFNSAKAGRATLSHDTMEVLSAARQYWLATDGAFDVTVRPLIRLWIQAAKTGTPPTAEQRKNARNASRWEQIELLPNSEAVKHADTTEVDLGGIAKGWGIDRAVEAMLAEKVASGIVEIGGDLRCFGLSARGQKWRIGLTDPFAPNSFDGLSVLKSTSTNFFAVLEIGSAAVCTSGNYRRSSTIAGVRYSHIIDPRDGENVGMALTDAFPASVTVVAPTALAADAWATALSVLGTEGLKLLPKDANIEAMIIIGDAKDYAVHITPGFAEFLVTPPARFKPTAATSAPQTRSPAPAAPSPADAR